MPEASTSSQDAAVSAMDLFVGLLALYSIVLLMVDLCMELNPAESELLFWMDNGLCVVFLTDFVWRLYRSRSSLSFWKWGWLDLLASIPMLPWFRWTRSVRLIRAFRILRAYRGVRLLHEQWSKRRGVTLASSVFFLFYSVILISAPAILIAESGTADANIRTPAEALWWVITTMSTVGYGDFYPVTAAGRLVGVFTMVLGIGLFGAVMASLMSLLRPSATDSAELSNIRADLEFIKAQLAQANLAKPQSSNGNDCIQH